MLLRHVRLFLFHSLSSSKLCSDLFPGSFFIAARFGAFYGSPLHAGVSPVRFLQCLRGRTDGYFLHERDISFIRLRTKSPCSVGHKTLPVRIFFTRLPQDHRTYIGCKILRIRMSAIRVRDIRHPKASFRLRFAQPGPDTSKCVSITEIKQIDRAVRKQRSSRSKRASLPLLHPGQ